ncbi:MAG: helix-turn-helix domain-containing protein [Acidimicrobiales bacterium]|jgi:SRSO17 transposase|nr:helix-turn-helix domain-containing protein [Acidimicrobiales bacterium]HLV89570.1 RNA polymerase subunit sigma-70 [Acidimicrobiia bacterium]
MSELAPPVTTAEDDPASGFDAVKALRKLADALEEQYVAVARRQGWTWQQIGDALGVTRQAVHKKHGR